MKKIIILFVLVLTILIVNIGNTYAYDIGDITYSYSTYELYKTENDENYYRVRIYVDDNMLSADMSYWYNAIDSLYARPHIYNFAYPIIFTYQGSVGYDGIYIMYIDYDLSSDEDSTIIFMDINGSLIGSITMDELTDEFDLIMIRSAILDPYAQGYANGVKDTTVIKDNYYKPIIQSLEYDLIYDVETAILNTKLGMFNNGSEYYDFDVTESFDYGVGHDEGYDVGYNLAINTDLDVTPIFDEMIKFIGNGFLIPIFPGMTIGGLAMIPISFALFKWFMKLFGGK